MRRIALPVLILSILLCPTFTDVSQAARVHVTDFSGEAEFKIFVTRFQGEANCIVYVTKFEGEAAQPGFWFLSPYSGGSVPIYFVLHPAEADLRVYFTSFPGEARCEL